jgi:flagellar FliL protein
MEAQLEDPTTSGGGSKKSINPKVFLIGLPLFILQLIIVYFVTTNILLTKFENNPQALSGEHAAESEDDEHSEEALGQHIFSIEDIIVNPAGTNGQRLLLVSLGVDVGSEEEYNTLVSKEFLVKDVVISTLSEKTMNLLGRVGTKDSLKVEISEKLANTIPSIKVNQIYFSKYVIN